MGKQGCRFEVFFFEANVCSEANVNCKRECMHWFFCTYLFPVWTAATGILMVSVGQSRKYQKSKYRTLSAGLGARRAPTRF